ncbi:MAG: DUF748 domain-containing protein [Rhodocyclaceae bacterium]|nr:DUF748 domain-containing protein [Rhodocyclaceae bacterium]
MTRSPPDSAQPGRRRRIFGWILGVFATLVLLFGVLGYFWLPGFAKTRLEQALGEQLKRPVSIEKIEISPYALTATVAGIKAGDVLSIGLIHIDLSSASLLQGVPVVREVRIERPELHLVRESADRLNVSDIIEAFLAKPESPPQEFSVSNISLSDGRIDWTDKVVGGQQKIDRITLGIPFVANTPSQVEIFVEPKFSAHVNGSRLSLNGKIRPFNAGRDGEMEIALNDIDLTPLTRYVKLPFGLTSARLDTRLGVHFKRPQGAAPSLNIEGDLALHAIDLRAGGQKAVVARIDMKGVKVDPFARRAALAELHIVKPVLEVRRSKDGRIDLGVVASPPAKTEVNAAGKKEAGKPWAWSIGKLAVDQGRLNYADATLSDARPLELSALAIAIGAVASDKDDAIPLELKTEVNRKGSIAVTGTASLSGDAELRLDLQQVDLVSLQGWVADRFNAVLTRGNLGFKGTTRLAAGRATVAGDLVLGDFNVLDRVNAVDLLRWKSLRLGRMDLATEPFAFAVGEVALSDFYAKVLINPEGRLNLKDIVKAAPAAAARPGSEAAPAVASPPALKLGAVILKNGSVDFSDKYIKPNYSARISELGGRIGALAAGTLSPVELRGKVDRTAPLEILGRIDPFSTPLGLDVRASARGIDLPPFSAYSGRYVGYAIEKGKLSMDVSYKVEKGELVAENKVFLDQLTFGEKVESKDALDLPINLAIALLKNSRGEIDIDLPIRGSLNDPQFSVGGIIVKVIVNLITKAVTAPFALIGSLFGGGEDLSQVAFAPGLAQVGAEAEPRLQAIAKAMADRPGLKLEVTGFADSAADSEGLKRVILNRKLRAQKLAEQTKQGKGGTLRDVTLSAEETPVYLEKVYKAADLPGKPKNLIGFAKSIPPAEMEALLLGSISAGDAELAALAEDRGQRVQAWLTEKGAIPLERIFLRGAKVEAGKDPKAASGGRVEFSLR